MLSEPAIHECGHLIVCLALGGTFEAVTIRPSGNAVGRLYAKWPRGRVCQIAMLAGGLLANTKVDCTMDHRIAGRDAEMIEELLEGTRNPDALRQRAVALAERCLRLNRDVLLALAERLDREHTLSPSNSDDLVRRIVFIDDKN